MSGSRGDSAGCGCDAGGDGGGDGVRVLGVMFSPRAGGNTEVVLDEAMAGAREATAACGGADARGPVRVTVEKYSLAGKKIGPCASCHRCRDLGTCVFKDDFQEFAAAWLEADGLLYATPVYHFGIPGSAKAALDKLAHVMFAKFDRKLPRFCKPAGVLAQGSSRYGGQEATIGQLHASLLLMNCLPVSGDTPGSYIGAPGFAPTWEKGSIRQDAESMAVARNLGGRVAEMTLVVRAGLSARRGILPAEYSTASR
jgi:multimeric flavodoxin WrbA